MLTPYVKSANVSASAPLDVDFRNGAPFDATGGRGYSVHGYVTNQGTSPVTLHLIDSNGVARSFTVVGYSSQPWDWPVAEVRVVGGSTSQVPVTMAAR